MDYWKKKRIEEDAQWEQWVEKINSLSWNDSDRSQILCLLLDTYGIQWIDCIEDILNSGNREEMEELIQTVEDRRKSIVNG
jgi:replication fork clamp-binding protein CrfC